MKKESVFLTQIVPISLTFIIFLALSGVLYGEMVLLNKFTLSDIILHIRLSDVLIGITIYVKTSVDFAIYMGNLMRQFTGWKNRVAIETGTALGNALGSIAILALWVTFRSIDWILAAAIIFASIVLLRLADEGLDHATRDTTMPLWFQKFIKGFDKALHVVNSFGRPVLRYIIPNVSMNLNKGLSFGALIGSSILIPFILGIDNFAGYIPVFSLVNVFGFLIGVFAAHMILNAALFLSPKKTTQVVENPVIAVLGSLVFVGLAVYGFIEAYKILFLH